jgi:hypothetical protein
MLPTIVGLQPNCLPTSFWLPTLALIAMIVSTSNRRSDGGNRSASLLSLCTSLVPQGAH